MKGQSNKNNPNIWLIGGAVIVALILISVAIPPVRASLSSWLGLSVATASQVPAAPVTMEALIPSAPTTSAFPQTQEPQLQATNGTATSNSTSTALLPNIMAASQADLSQFSSQVGWNILTPGSLPEGYHYQSAYFDPNQKLLVVTYLVTRPLPGATDPSLTSSETISFLQAQHNDFVPMQIAPNTVVTDTLVNDTQAVFTMGGWDTEYVKDSQAPGGGKMVSSWRNDLPVKNLYWQVGSLYLALITADGNVSQQELTKMADSMGK